MCNIRKISEEKNRIVNGINQTMSVSGATILKIEKEMEEIEERAKRNIHSLSLLL